MENLEQNQVFERPAIHNLRRIIRSLKAKVDAKRNFSQKLADFVTDTFGSIGFLTMLVSLEALI